MSLNVITSSLMPPASRFLNEGLFCCFVFFVCVFKNAFSLTSTEFVTNTVLLEKNIYISSIKVA